MGKRGPPPDPARIAAKEAERKRYVPSDRRACKNGHLAERLTSNGNCCECRRLAYPWTGKVAKKGREIVIA
jgi:hypothetical protein